MKKNDKKIECFLKRCSVSIGELIDFILEKEGYFMQFVNIHLYYRGISSVYVDYKDIDIYDIDGIECFRYLHLACCKILYILHIKGDIRFIEGNVDDLKLFIENKNFNSRMYGYKYEKNKVTDIKASIEIYHKYKEDFCDGNPKPYIFKYRNIIDMSKAFQEGRYTFKTADDVIFYVEKELERYNNDDEIYLPITFSESQHGDYICIINKLSKLTFDPSTTLNCMRRCTEGEALLPDWLNEYLQELDSFLSYKKRKQKKMYAVPQKEKAFLLDISISRVKKWDSNPNQNAPKGYSPNFSKEQLVRFKESYYPYGIKSLVLKSSN